METEALANFAAEEFINKKKKKSNKNGALILQNPHPPRKLQRYVLKWQP